MEKKKYTKPELEIVEISHSAPLLDCSGGGCDEELNGETGSLFMPTDIPQA